MLNDSRGKGEARIKDLYEHYDDLLARQEILNKKISNNGALLLSNAENLLRNPNTTVVTEAMLQLIFDIIQHNIHAPKTSNLTPTRRN